MSVFPWFGCLFSGFSSNTLWVQVGVFNVIQLNPFCGAFVAGRTWRVWFPCSPQQRLCALCVCVPVGSSSSWAVPSLQPGRDFAWQLCCVSHYMQAQVCAVPGSCTAPQESCQLSPLRQTGWQCSTWSGGAPSSATLRVVGFPSFPLWLGFFFLSFLPGELFSRGEQPVSYSGAGCKLPKAYKIKLVLVINPWVHYLLFAIFHVCKLFSWFFFINLIFNQSVTSIDLPSQLVYNDNFLQDTFFILEYHRCPFCPTNSHKIRHPYAPSHLGNASAGNKTPEVVVIIIIIVIWGVLSAFHTKCLPTEYFLLSK